MSVQNSPARAAVDVGSVIAGTYTIEALIGRGGMGAVFLASHARLPGKKVAIKVLHAEMSGDEILARFKREAQIASMLSHPNIVHIEDYNVTEDGMPYLVLEYLQGESLAQRLKRGPLTPEQAFSIIRQVGSALAAAHNKGIVHRDLKPQNIFLVPSEIDGRSFEVAKVLDFGISKMRDSQTVKTQDSALLGTPQYMAPEQATGQHANVDERTDVFALGAIVYEMLAGQPAFSGASIPEVVFKVVYEQPAQLSTHAPSLSAQIATAVHRAMSKPSGERYSTVSDFIEALTGSPLPAPRSGNSLPPPDVGFATGSRLAKDSAKQTGNDAFANTMGSGDHSAAVANTVGSGDHGAAIANTVGSGDHGAAVANTVDSGNRPNAVVAKPIPPTPATVADRRAVEASLGGKGGQVVAELAPTVSSGTTAPRSRTGLIVGLSLGLALIGGIVLFLATRPDSRPSANEQLAQSPPSTIESRAASNVDVKGEAGGGSNARAGSGASAEASAQTGSSAGTEASAQAGAEASAPAGSNAAKSDPKTDTKIEAKRETKSEPKSETKTGSKKTGAASVGSSTATASAAGEDDEGDATWKQKLQDADAALKATEWVRAEQLANSVINSEDATVKQKARAAMLHGIAQCLGRNNEEGALMDLRRLRGSPALRAKLLKTCQQAGFLVGER